MFDQHGCEFRSRVYYGSRSREARCSTIGQWATPPLPLPLKVRYRDPRLRDSQAGNERNDRALPQYNDGHLTEPQWTIRPQIRQNSRRKIDKQSSLLVVKSMNIIHTYDRKNNVCQFSSCAYAMSTSIKSLKI